MIRRDTSKNIHAVILDGYVDEPALLGVPPYISPEPRLLAGVLEEAGLTYDYVTADEYRISGLPPSDIIIVHGGTTVPGTYLGGTPLSLRECRELGKNSNQTESFLGGPLARAVADTSYDHISVKDLSAYLHESLKGNPRDRWGELDERERWLCLGAKVVKKHPLYPDPLLAEVSTYRGCVRYFTGGCSFCSEPGYGKPKFREQEDVIAEISTLYKLGIQNFRLGGQSCIVSYKADGIGKKERPVPRADEIRRLFRGINNACPDISILHVDNANPGVIAAHPEESRKILNILVENTTSGNVLALGMESADPRVIESNNLNATPEDVETSVVMINEVGAGKGESGMPELLPGINFLAGLKGERKETYELNLSFLEKILDSGLFLRRINIRQVLPHRMKCHLKYPKEFKKFKSIVRERIDQVMLKKMLPGGTVLKDVYMELHRGKQTFGRQIGTYPILVGIEYPLRLGEYNDVIIIDHGYRSVTGLHYPFFINKASFSELKALPGIGEKRAARIFRARPSCESDLKEVFDDSKVVKEILRYAIFSN